MSAPGFLLAGTHSGCGKSTLTAGLLRAFLHSGKVIAPFKAGPDYLDPLLHRFAAGRVSWNLDGWFLEDDGLRKAYARGSAGAELALVEGVMGLFDGADPVSFRGSGADLALRLGLPVVLVVDASGVGGSVAATVLGHARLHPGLSLAGVIFNRVTSERHYQLLKSAVETHTDVKPLGWAGQFTTWRLPERHLGIYHPDELPELESQLQDLALELASTVELEALAALARSPGIDPVIEASSSSANRSADLPVALARDAAFHFIYADTLDRLERLGVRWVPFSPLRERLPEGVAGLYLPGGYPELHAEELSRAPFLADLRAAQARGLPIFAECGGYMVLAEALVDTEGRTHPMAGLIPGRTCMTKRLQSFGYKRLTALRDTLFCAAGGQGKAHEFHHSVWEGERSRPAWKVEDLHGEGVSQGFASGNVLASYAHIPFDANPGWAEAWVSSMHKDHTRQALSTSSSRS